MVPEGACLVGDVELVQERLIRANRTLVNSSHSIGIVGAMLEDTVPMLTLGEYRKLDDDNDSTYDGGGTIHGIICHLIHDIERERIALVGLDDGSGEDAIDDGGSIN